MYLELVVSIIFITLPIILTRILITAKRDGKFLTHSQSSMEILNLSDL